MSCIFPITVSNVPDGGQFYQVGVTHRSKVTVTADDAKSGRVALRMGCPAAREGMRTTGRLLDRSPLSSHPRRHQTGSGRRLPVQTTVDGQQSSFEFTGARSEKQRPSVPMPYCYPSDRVQRHVGAAQSVLPSAPCCGDSWSCSAIRC